MKLTKQLEQEILQVYHAYWDYYLKGDMQSFTAMLHDRVSIFGSSANEAFTNKKEAVEFYAATAGQIAGKAAFRNRQIHVVPVDNDIMINEQLDFYVLVNDQWIFYAHARISTLFHKTRGKWKIIHQHGSLPDARAGEGEQLNTDQVKAENLQLREAVKRRTLELEDKNRELEIESSLERVRTVAMSMNKPADMLQVCRIILGQLENLGIRDVRNVQTAIFNNCKGTYINYEYYGRHDKSLITEVDYTTDDMTASFAAQMMKGDGETFTKTLTGTALKNWYAFQQTTPQFADPHLAEAASLNYYWFSLGPIALGVSTYAPLNETEIAVFNRFRQVFQLAYRRFLDIQQAEAQAREAKVEAALEKVRSRSLAMHKSDEIKEVVVTVMEKMNELNIDMNGGVSLVTFVEGSQDLLHWYTNPGHVDTALTMHLPYFNNVVFNDFVEARKAGKEILPVVYSFEQKNEYFKYAFEHSDFKVASGELKKWIFDQPYFGYSVAIQKHSAIFFNDYTGSFFSTDTNDILIRFSKVFDQSYIRFLDLQKAEAQAKEAKIEAALERTRTQSMIMQHSKELDDTLRVFHEQVLLLGIHSAFSFLWLPDEDKGRHIFWAAWAKNNPAVFKSKAIDYPLDRNEPATAQCLIDWKSNEPVVSYHVQPGGVENYFAAWSELIAGVEELKPENFSNGLYYVEAFMRYGCFGVMVKSELQEDEKKILARFAVEFERTYTRFLDLKKAEAQSKENQIQLALERVRARTMAMQHSNELPDAANILFQQVQTLGMPAWSAGYCIWDDDKQAITLWMSSAGIIQKPFRAPVTEDPSFIHFYDAWKRGETFFVEEIGGNAIVSHYQYMLQLPVVGEMLKQFITDGGALPTFQIYHLAFFSQGFLLFITYEPVPEAHDIFKRFSKVFEQTYTRFLDLQKAEAQAREAQIEAALEKVRSRSLAMHQSEELKEVVAVIFEKLKTLNFAMNDSAAVIITFIKDSKDHIQWIADPGQAYSTSFRIPYSDHSIPKDILTAKEGGVDFFSKLYAFEEKNNYFKYLFANTDYGGLPYEIKELLLQSHVYGISIAFEKNAAILVPTNTGTLLSEKEKEILKRFAKVFEQTYTRFLDLQKAEAQAREAQIEAALERVRSRTMGMQKSAELKDVIQVVYEQFVHLNIKIEHTGFIMDYKARDDMHIWLADRQEIPSQVTIPYFDSAHWNSFIEAKEKGLDFFANQLDFEEKNRFYQDLFKIIPGLPDEAKEYYFSCPGLAISTVLLDNVGLYIENFSGIPYSEEENNTLLRFGKVFQQTYTRFLDLQKAEEQTREAKIEIALERIRARTMAMQRSDELAETVSVVFKQLLDLGIQREQMRTCAITTIKADEQVGECWITTPDGNIVPRAFMVPYDEGSAYKPIYDAWKQGEKFLVVHLEGDALVNHLNHLKNFAGVPTQQFEALPNQPAETYTHALFFSQGYLLIISNQPLLEYHEVFKRFGAVFQQTYTRFLDLQKAEAQTREAKIEAALERVRSKTMAMHSSADVGETAAVMVGELKKLGVETIRCGIGTMHELGDMELWTIRTDENDKTDIIIGRIDMNIHPLLQGAFENWRNKNEYYSYELKGDDLLNYYNAINHYPGYPIRYDMNSLPGLIYHNQFYFAEGTLFAFSLAQLSQEQRKILKRFAGVFGQTYRRYLDLKKAEAQAREAKIEAAMEKVRSNALAMQKPGELVEVAQLLRKEMNALGVEELETSSIYIHHEDTQKTECWYAIKDVAHAEKELVSDHMIIELNQTWVGRQMLAFYHSDKKQASIIMQGADRKEWINYCVDHSKVLMGFYGDDIPDRIYHLYKFSNGYMGAASPGDISAESWDLLQRATSVFSLAYTRFSDLQQAEAQAREAQIEVALERVRSRTLAMQKSDELAETAAVVFRQLITLGIAPNRLYITIIKDEGGDMEFWITDEDGTRVGSKFAANAHQNRSFQKMYEGWTAHKKSITIDMQGDELVNYFQHLNELGVPFKLGLTQKRRIQNIAYFGKGFIGMASPDEQPEATISLLERFAAVFNLTYTRFNDLQVAEAHAVQAGEDLIKLQTEKRRAENALTELRETQKQLIQSEKMASLGELTAGIAHEIQNPLNFVNNFSEVSNELIDEMMEEVTKGNYEEVKLIVDDIKQNLEKINHHGKRADGIVKGMLQHSRSGSATREPTDVNKLVDEYLRLAYHGLRAKDKAFNATLQTDYDESIGCISMLPQDMGRVILNLITNAFYAVNEKKKLLTDGYEPIVKVITARIVDKIEIKVEDNGNGIQQKIIDKIFQPFFTTKPTGQGTGLGLSLAYDIVKAHGGEIKVESKEQEGTTFIIQVPATAE